MSGEHEQIILKKYYIQNCERRDAHVVWTACQMTSTAWQTVATSTACRASSTRSQFMSHTYSGSKYHGGRDFLCSTEKFMNMNNESKVDNV